MRRVSIQTPPQSTSFSQLRDFWQAADDMGFHACYTFDHLVPLLAGESPVYRPSGPRAGGQLEGWLTVAALAASTRRLQVGTLVTDVSLRPPALLAKMAVTLDEISAGRAVLGVGAGWHREEHEMYGIDFFSAGERVSRLEETLELWHALRGTAQFPSYSGRRYSVAEAHFEPRAFRDDHAIPVLVGGSGSRVKGAAARHADVFNSFASAADWPDLNRELDALLTAAGRSASDLVRSAYLFAELSGDPGREDTLVATVADRTGIPAAQARDRVILGDAEHNHRVLTELFEAGVEEAVLGLTPPYEASQLAVLSSELPSRSAVEHSIA